MVMTEKSDVVRGRKRLRKPQQSDESETESTAISPVISQEAEQSSNYTPDSPPKRKSSRSNSTKHDNSSPKSKKSSKKSVSSKSKSSKSKSNLSPTSIFSRSVIELVGSDDDFEQPPAEVKRKYDKKVKSAKAKADKSPPKRSRKSAQPLPQEEDDDIITLGDTDDDIEDACWSCQICSSLNSHRQATCKSCNATLTSAVSSSQSTSSSRQLWQETLETPVTKKSQAKTSAKSRSTSKSQSSRKRKSETDDIASHSIKHYQGDTSHDFDDFLDENAPSASLSQSVDPSSASTDKPVVKVPVEDWCVKYAPQSVDVLAVHAKKIAQIREWIDRNVCNDAPFALSPVQPFAKQSMLILTGPPGCCKSTMVELLAASRNVTCCRFEESLQPRTNFSSTRYADRDGESLSPKSKLDVFEQFLSQSTRYSSLVGDVVTNKRVVLIEELPFVGDDDLHQRFLSIIQTALYRSHFSLILCLSDMHEDSGAFAIEQLLTSAILCDPHVAHIECNAVNVTLMKKALKRIIEKEQIDVNPGQLDAIVARARGDLRQAIQTLQFEFQHRHPAPKASKSKASRSKGVKAKPRTSPVENAEIDDSLQSSARDSSASLFHSLGRILYAKREHSVDSIIEQCADERQILLPMIQQNYMPFFRLDESLDHVVAASHSISLADCGIGEDFRADSFREVSLWLLCEEIVQERSLYRAEHPDSTVYRPGQSGLLAFRASDALRVPRIVARKKLMSARHDGSDLPDSTYFTQTLPYSELVSMSALSQSFRFSQGKEIRSLPSTFQTEIVPQINRAQTASESTSVVEEDPIEDA